MNRPAFHGSYRAQDVEFLLKPLGRGDLNMPANVWRAMVRAWLPVV